MCYTQWTPNELNTDHSLPLSVQHCDPQQSSPVWWKVDTNLKLALHQWHHPPTHGLHNICAVQISCSTASCMLNYVYVNFQRMYCIVANIASFPGARKIGGSTWYTLFTHARSLLGNLHTICYTNHALTKQSISVYLLISHTAEICSLWDALGGFKVKNTISLTAKACIILFRAINELQRERLHHSCATAFTWMDKWANNFC